MQPPRLYLASASPRRFELLRQVGLSPYRVPAHVDEAILPGESATSYVLRLAETKARAALGRLDSVADGIVLAADTEVILDGEPLGKPRDAADAEAMLRRLRGRRHDVLTGVFLSRTDGSATHAGVETTHVWFGEFSEATLRGYVAGGEPGDKAGAYGIQGRGALLVERIEGSWANVVGLPVERLPDWAGRIGIDLPAMIDWTV